MQSREYDRLYQAEDRHWWFRALRLFITRLLPKPELGLLALDVGCGTGGLMKTLLEVGYRPIGLDFSVDALRFASRRENNGLIRTNASDLPFIPIFDLVISIDLLEVETVDPTRLVAEAIRVLKPGGYGLFVMAAHQWLLSEHDRAVNSVRRFNLPRIKALFTDSGTKITKASYLFFTLFPLIALRKLFNPSREHKGVEASSDVSVPPVPINATLYGLCWLEAQLLSVWNMPMGSSVVVVVRKDG